MRFVLVVAVVFCGSAFAENCAQVTVNNPLYCGGPSTCEILGVQGQDFVTIMRPRIKLNSKNGWEGIHSIGTERTAKSDELVRTGKGICKLLPNYHFDPTRESAIQQSIFTHDNMHEIEEDGGLRDVSKRGQPIEYVKCVKN